MRLVFYTSTILLTSREIHPTRTSVSLKFFLRLSTRKHGKALNQPVLSTTCRFSWKGGYAALTFTKISLIPADIIVLQPSPLVKRVVVSRPNRLGAAIAGIRTQHQATNPPTNPRPNGDETPTSTGQHGSILERQFSDSGCLDGVSIVSIVTSRA